MKKTFVILSQGCELDWDLAKKHKNQFNTEFSDCFRLNWKGDKSDKNADFFKDNITWSEGRSYLYEQTKGKYEYYIFIDHDVDITSKTKLDAANQIKQSLEKYKPIHGSIPNMSPVIGKYSSEVVGMVGGDMCVQFFSENFAELMFPTWLHGAERSMHYCQFLAYMICPSRSLYLNFLEANNTLHKPHLDHTKDNFAKPHEVIKYFLDLLKSKDHREIFSEWGKARWAKCKSDYEPNPEPLILDINKINNFLKTS
jgi:hypothetical protein